MKQIDVSLGERSYPVVIGHGLIDRAGELLEPFARGRRLVVVSDANVWSELGERLSRAINRRDIDVAPVTLTPGEGSKNWATMERLINALLDLGVGRGDYLVAFGGGVVGDLAGFAAAILKRGCFHVQIPTTLLAQVDASVGGKTAINVAAGKNLVGAFHQPSAVLIDPATLDTLPDRELRAGYSEVVKYGLIGDADFFAWCEGNSAAVIGGDGEQGREARLHAIEHSVSAKAAIVAGDEWDTKGSRARLNFGPTFGPAREAETGFSDRLLHGEAVALGMALAFRFSALRGLCPPPDAARVAAHLKAAGLPTTLAEAGITADGPSLVAHMAHDKKRADGRLPFIMARRIGEAFVDSTISKEEAEAFLDGEAR